MALPRMPGGASLSVVNESEIHRNLLMKQRQRECGHCWT